jgi:hypothetical protein
MSSLQWQAEAGGLLDHKLALLRDGRLHHAAMVTPPKPDHRFLEVGRYHRNEADAERYVLQSSNGCAANRSDFA